MKDNKKNWEIIGEYFNEETNPQKKREIEITLKQNEETIQNFETSKKIWNTIPHLIHVDPDSKKKHIAQINEVIFGKSKQRNIFTKILQSRFRAAAVILLLISIGIYLYFLTTKTETIWLTENTQIGKRNLITLNDGTVIWLNEYSSVSYPEDYSKENRKLKLQGEAFFDIAKSQDHPFIIYTPHSLVRVIGTSFNLEDRKEKKLLILKVVTGKVAFSDKKNKEQIVRADQKLLFDKEKNTSKIITDNHKDDWRDENIDMVFENTPIELIINTLSKQYQIPILLSEKLNEKRLTAKYSTDRPIVDILTSISIALDLKYELRDGQYIISIKK